MFQAAKHSLRCQQPFPVGQHASRLSRAYRCGWNPTSREDLWATGRYRRTFQSRTKSLGIIQMPSYQPRSITYLWYMLHISVKVHMSHVMGLPWIYDKPKQVPSREYFFVSGIYGCFYPCLSYCTTFSPDCTSLPAPLYILP